MRGTCKEFWIFKSLIETLSCSFKPKLTGSKASHRLALNEGQKKNKRKHFKLVRVN
jgi:hypothetical protein